MQQSLTYTHGITTNPSDQLSADSELAESVGIIYRDGELHPIQSVPVIANIPYKIVYVHKMADYDNIIAYSDNVNRIYCYKHDGGSITEIEDNSFLVGDLRSIESVGNTLVVSTDEGLHYFLYKGGAYKDLGTSLPDVKVTPKFGDRTMAVNSVMPWCNIKDMCKSDTSWAAYFKNDELVTVSQSQPESGSYDSYSAYIKFDYSDDYEKYQSLQTAIQGHVALVVSKIKEDNHFAFPFFLRYALRLYDGSYTRISAPIACYPTISKNFSMFPSTTGMSYAMGQFFSGSSIDLWRCWIANATLYCDTVLKDADNWSDIVKEVVVFASDDVMPFYIDETYNFHRATEVNHTAWANFIGSRHQSGQHSDTDGTTIYMDGTYNYHFSYSEASQQACDVILPKFKSERDIIDELLTKSQFYKLFSIPVTDTDYINAGFVKANIKANVVSNLTEQEQLQKDDYYGWTKMIATSLFSYNKRLNVIGMERYPYKGFNVFTDYVDDAETLSDKRKIDFYVHIVSDTMDVWVKADYDDDRWTNQDTLNSWFYYPDPNATEYIVWYVDSNKGVRYPLKRHDLLNGAYAFNRLPLSTEETTGGATQPSVDATAHETLDSQVFTSVVNNPYLFEASGDNTVGTGSILAVTSNTEPVSTGQFGQYPLIVFTSEGIYGMSVNTEGLYSASYPISRDVCNNADSVTPTDSSVFFTTDKGLMAIAGGQATLMSYQLAGHLSSMVTLPDCEFATYLKSCHIAYDYRNALLHIYNEEKDYHWVYSLASKTYALCNDGYKITSAVQSYPDFLIQDGNDDIRSFSSIPLPIDDTASYTGSFITRPLKFDGSLIRKSLQRIRHIYDSVHGSVTLNIFASDDGHHWVKLTSLHGKPWRFFVFKYSFTGFLAIDAYSATVVDCQQRTSFH